MTSPAAYAFALNLVVLLGLAISPGRAADPPNPAGLKLFKSKIRPLLETHCYECHGAKKQKSGLRLDSIKAMIEGGEGGPAVVPGDVENSALINAVSYEDADLQMPPDGKLEDTQIADLKRWIELGAPGGEGK